MFMCIEIYMVQCCMHSAFDCAMYIYLYIYIYIYIFIIDLTRNIYKHIIYTEKHIYV